MLLDFSLNVTTVVGVLVWIITLTIAWTKFGGRIDMLELRVANMERALEKIAEVLLALHANEKELLVVTEQIGTLQRDMAHVQTTLEELRRGEGWITNRRNSVDGVY